MQEAIVVKRFQWMRNAGSGQRFGNRQEIRLLDESAFKRFVLPRLRSDVASSFSAYRKKFPQVTHYSVVWRDGDEEWQFVGVGSLEELLREPRTTKWAKEVDSFDATDAISFGQIADSD